MLPWSFHMKSAINRNFFYNQQSNNSRKKLSQGLSQATLFQTSYHTWISAHGKYDFTRRRNGTGWVIVTEC